MEMKSTDQATLYPSLEQLKTSAPNAYDNLPEEQNASRVPPDRPEGGEAALAFRLHKINETLKILRD
jgi:hypothetical protein